MKVRRISMLLGIVVCAVLMVTGCVDGAKRTAIAVDEMHLPETERFFSTTAKDIYIAGIEISNPPTGEEIVGLTPAKPGNNAVAYWK